MDLKRYSEWLYSTEWEYGPLSGYYEYNDEPMGSSLYS
jgi:hypothetical protein